VSTTSKASFLNIFVQSVHASFHNPASFTNNFAHITRSIMDAREKERSLKLAEHYFRDNNYSFAQLILDRVIKVDSNNSKANELLAYIYGNLGQFDISFELLKVACSQNDRSSEALYYLGSMQLKRSLFTEAIQTFQKSILKGGEFFEALHDLASAQAQIGDHTSANFNYQKCLKFGKESYELLYNIARTFGKLKRYDEAIAYFDKALSLKPDYAQAWSNKGNVLNELKRHNEAIAHYDKAISLKPDYANAWLNKGNVLNELKRHNEAIAHYDKAISLEPDYAQTWSNKGNVLNELKRHNEAITHFNKALILKPDIEWIYGDLVHTKMKICNWLDLQNSLHVISEKVMANEKASTPFILLSLNDDASFHKKSSEIFSQNKYPMRPDLDTIPKSAKKEKIRIAYFSPDFRNHPVSFLTSELFEIHNRHRFEVFAFSLQEVPVDDETNLRLRKGFDKFLNVENMSDMKIAQLARKLEIDIAIDLAGLTQHSRTGIFSYRVAPIQVNWLGYPGTIGADYIDYIVSDNTIIPECSNKFYNEKVVRLPHTYIVDDSKRVPSSRVFTREECGLPENAFVFCCFNIDYKFNPKVLDRWAKILLAVKNSVLWISENNKNFKCNITTEFEARGIECSRLIFAKRVELMTDHLARYKLADLFLDTYPYNAHTTAVDSLKAGVPVLTLMGQSFASRVAASLLNAICLPELITNTNEEYEAIAIELALNSNKLKDIKSKLKTNRLTAPLFDTPLFTKNLEAAYINMMERYLADLQPDHIFIT
jgi:protein O-GlcNAc transferase